MDLRQPGEFIDDLFAALQPVATNKLMGVLDEINGRWGRGTLHCERADKPGLGYAPRAYESGLYDQARSIVDRKSQLTKGGV